MTFYVKSQLGTHTLQLDSGSKFSYISSSLVKRYNISNFTIDNFVITLADSTEKQITNACKIQIKLHDSTPLQTTICYILDGCNHDLIFGDVIHK